MKPETEPIECCEPAGSAESLSRRSTIPPQLMEQLARIIARALVADYRADLLKTSAVPATANSEN